MTEQEINDLIKLDHIDTNLISDGYHNFGELYDHRIVLFIDLCFYLDQINKGWLKYDGELVRKSYQDRFGENVKLGANYFKKHFVWRSKKHSDGSEWNGWFIMGIDKEKGKQITYHLPISYWENTQWVETLDQAPEWDGHTSADVLERLKSL